MPSAGGRTGADFLPRYTLLGNFGFLAGSRRKGVFAEKASFLNVHLILNVFAVLSSATPEPLHPCWRLGLGLRPRTTRVVEDVLPMYEIPPIADRDWSLHLYS